MVMEATDKDREAAAGGADRREHLRLPYNKRVHLAWIRPGDRCDAPVGLMADDISRGGIRLRGDVEFRSGRSGVLQIRRQDGSAALVGLRVVHARTVGPGVHIAGARFFPLKRDFVRSALAGADGNVRPFDAVSPAA